MDVRQTGFEYTARARGGVDVATRARASARARASRPRNRKEMILRVATELFVRDGYHRTAMADIAATLGITSTALYRHYRNKQQLLAKTLLDGLQLVVSELGKAAEADDKLGAVIDVLATLAVDHRGRAALWQREMRHLAPGDRRAIMKQIGRNDVRLRSILMHARPELDEADAELLAWCLIAVFESVSYHRVPMARERFIALLTDLAWRVAGTDLAKGSPNTTGVVIDEVHRTGLPDLTDQMSRGERLLAVATQLFDRRGYAAVGIEDIGAAAGITGPSVYYHFAGKSDLLTEIVERGAEAIEYYASRALAEGRDHADTLERMARYYAGYAHAQPDLIGVVVGEVIHLPPDSASRYRDVQRDGVRAWVRELCAARPNLDSAAARMTVQAVIMAINDAVRLPQLAGRPRLIDDLATVSMAVLLPQ